MPCTVLGLGDGEQISNQIWLCFHSRRGGRKNNYTGNKPRVGQCYEVQNLCIYIHVIWAERHGRDLWGRSIPDIENNKAPRRKVPGMFGGQQGSWGASVESGLGGGFSDVVREGARAWTTQGFIARVEEYIGFYSGQDGRLLSRE